MSFKTLEEMYNTREYMAYIADKLGNDLFINDPDRAERIHNAAEQGCDGSLHCEIIEDWREFLDMSDGISEEDRDNITKQIDEVEKWHMDNGSLFTEVG